MLLQVARTESPRGFRLIGEIDVSNADILTDALEPEVEQGGDLTLDLTGLTFMDSSGIQVIIRTARRLEGSGNLRLLRPGAVVAHTLERVRLGQLASVEMILDDDQSLETA